MFDLLFNQEADASSMIQPAFGQRGPEEILFRIHGARYEEHTWLLIVGDLVHHAFAAADDLHFQRLLFIYYFKWRILIFHILLNLQFSLSLDRGMKARAEETNQRGRILLGILLVGLSGGNFIELLRLCFQGPGFHTPIQHWQPEWVRDEELILKIFSSINFCYA